VLFVWNANRLARGQRTLWLSQDGTEAMRELQDADGLVVSGAGAFNDRFANHVGLVWGIIMRSVAAFGKPVVVSGQQIGPLNRFVCRRVTRWALQVARVVGVRDPISIDVAKALGIPSDRIVLTGDDAWGLEPSGEEEAARVLSRYEISGRFIVAQIRLDPATDLKPQDAPKLASMLDKLAEMLELPVVFVRMYYATHNDDAVSAKQVQSFMTRQSVIIDEELSPALTKAVLKSAALAVGISYHFCIFAVSAGTPTLGLHRSAYMNHKLDGISQMWGSRMTSLSLDDGNVMDEVRAYIERTKQEILSDTSRQSLRTEYRVQEEAAISALINALDIQKDAVSRGY
jgi:polysaccharide pyruvyl transferase WcaK-like protein